MQFDINTIRQNVRRNLWRIGVKFLTPFSLGKISFILASLAVLWGVINLTNRSSNPIIIIDGNDEIVVGSDKLSIVPWFVIIVVVAIIVVSLLYIFRLRILSLILQCTSVFFMHAQSKEAGAPKNRIDTRDLKSTEIGDMKQLENRPIMVGWLVSLPLLFGLMYLSIYSMGQSGIFIASLLFSVVVGLLAFAMGPKFSSGLVGAFSGTGLAEGLSELNGAINTLQEFLLDIFPILEAQKESLSYGVVSFWILSIIFTILATRE